MKKVYFVTWYLHNKTNDGWAYKVEGKYTSKSAADKAFYTVLSTYTGGETYDVVIALLTDSEGFIWDIRNWTPNEDVEPKED